jgi:branched-chain amino acid transport system substrate-binding protein
VRPGLALLLFLALAAPAAAQDKTIYSSLPLQGDARAQSLSISRAMRMALADSGRTDVRYVSLDDATRQSGKWEPEQVLVNTHRVREDESAVAYLGEFNSGATAVSAPILNELGLLQISPSNTYVGLTRPEGAEKDEPDRYRPTERLSYGRVIPADHTQAHALLAYARDRGRRRVALVDDGEVYGRGLARMMKSLAAAYGIEIVLDGRLARQNETALAQVVRRAGADAMIFAGITQNGAARLWKAVHKRNRRIELFGSDGVFEEAFTRRIGRSAAARTFLVYATLPAATYPAAGQEFFRRYRAKYGRAPEPYAIYGYEAMALALDSLARGGNTREGALAAFFATRDRASVLGTYSIDENGDTTLADYGGYRVTRGGRLRFHERLLARP